MTVIRMTRSPRVERALWFIILSSVAVLFQLGCAASHAREMSASEHRLEAEQARLRADAHRAAGRITHAASAQAAPAGLPVMTSTDGEDSGWHLLEAARHAYHARQHQAAAAALERSEEVECRALPAAVRAACPILTFVSQVREIEGGIRVRFLPQADVGQVAALMRCHLAFARARGFDRVPTCPLYTSGVEIRRVGDAIDVTGDTLEVVAEIRERIREVAAVAR
jgi:hypothetical protein